MAAGNSSTSGGGSKNFYNVAYGSLWGTSKEPLVGYEEIDAVDLKARTLKGESVDVRNKYVKKDSGNYPFKNSFGFIEGDIQGVSVDETDNGKVLVLDMIDTDGDNSLVQTKLYSKYAENLLNRLCGLSDFKGIYLSPYAIPNEFEVEEKGKKKTVKNFNQGFSVKQDGKVEMKYKHDNKDLPKTERVKNPSDGKLMTSRIARIDFLLDEVLLKFGEVSPKAELVEVGSEPPF